MLDRTRLCVQRGRVCYYEERERGGTAFRLRHRAGSIIIGNRVLYRSIGAGK